MFTRKKNPKRVVAFILVILLCMSVTAPMASARGSLYISSYLAYITAISNGKVVITFEIVGMGKMDEIGATTIYLYENGSTIKTYSYSTTSGMMASNKWSHGNEITYNGVVGRTYSALVVFKSGVNGGWDNRSLDTQTVTAKN